MSLSGGPLNIFGPPTKEARQQEERTGASSRVTGPKPPGTDQRCSQLHLPGPLARPPIATSLSPSSAWMCRRSPPNCGPVARRPPPRRVRCLRPLDAQPDPLVRAGALARSSHVYPQACSSRYPSRLPSGATTAPPLGSSGFGAAVLAASSSLRAPAV